MLLGRAQQHQKYPPPPPLQGSHGSPHQHPPSSRVLGRSAEPARSPRCPRQGGRPSGSSAPGLPAPAPTPLPTPPGKTGPLQCKHVPPSRPLGRPRRPGRTLSLPAGTATGARTALPRALGPPGSQSPPAQGFPSPPPPQSPARGTRLLRAGLGACRDGTSVSRLLLRNANDSENAAFPPRSNARPRITPAPAPPEPPRLAASGSCPWPPLPRAGRAAPPQQGTLSRFIPGRSGGKKPAQTKDGGGSRKCAPPSSSPHAPAGRSCGRQPGPTTPSSRRCLGVSPCQGGQRARAPWAGWAGCVPVPSPALCHRAEGRGKEELRLQEPAPAARCRGHGSLESGGSRRACPAEGNAASPSRKAPPPPNRAQPGRSVTSCPEHLGREGVAAPQPPTPTPATPRGSRRSSPCMAGGCVTQAEQSKA